MYFVLREQFSDDTKQRLAVQGIPICQTRHIIGERSCVRFARGEVLVVEDKVWSELWKMRVEENLPIQFVLSVGNHQTEMVDFVCVTMRWHGCAFDVVPADASNEK